MAHSAGQVCHSGFHDMNSAVLIVRGTWVLAVAEDDCGSLWGSSGLYFEHCFRYRCPRLLALILHPTDADFIASSPADFWAYLVQIPGADLPETLSQALGLQLEYGWICEAHCHEL